MAKAKDIPLILAGGTKNHVHLLIALPAVVALAKAMQELKGNSSRWLNHRGSGFAWQQGYSALSVSPSQKRVVMAYIAEQERHHAKRNFENELLAMLKKAGVKCDPRYVFD